MANLPATNRQVPDHSIMDINGKQAYLGNQFLANSGVVALASTSETALISIACPSLAAQAVGAFPNAKALFISLRRMFCNDATGATGIVYRIYLNATLSAGTARAISNVRPANPQTSIASVLASPAASPLGVLASIVPVGFNSPAVLSDMIIIDAGQNMLITAQATAASSAVVDLSWFEI